MGEHEILASVFITKVNSMYRLMHKGFCFKPGLEYDDDKAFRSHFVLYISLKSGSPELK